MGSWWKTPWQFFCVCGLGEGRGFEHRLSRKDLRDAMGVEGVRRGRRRVSVPVPARPPLHPPLHPAGPLRLTGGFLHSFEARDEDVVGCGGFVEVVLLALSLERARQFVKAFGERGGDLHVT